MKMIRHLYLIVFLFVGVLSSHISKAQCESKVVASTSVSSNSTGEIEVKVTTSERFVCRINTISGDGIQLVDSRNGSGNSTLTFSNLDVAKIYQVEVEFTTENNRLCKRLQQNDLVFESN
jgi:hypothetical protein